MGDLAKASDGHASRASPPAAPPVLRSIKVKSQNPITQPPAEPESRPNAPPPARDSSPDQPRSPKSPDRLRGGGPKSPAARAPKSPKSPKSSKSPKSPQAVRSLKTPSFVPPDMVTPVFPASPQELVGAMTSMDTGLTYPWNEWGPITKYGYLDNIAPTWAQKAHFGGKHDKIMKKRLTSRKFSYVRHPAYKELIEPEEKTCASYMDPKRKEFWRTDVDNVLRREMQEKKDRYRRLLDYIGNEEGWRQSELQRDREDRWQAFLDYDKNVKWCPGFRNNQSGVKYDLFTHAPTDEYEEKRVKYVEAKKRYKEAKRGLYIQERMSGARPYNIISWRKEPPCRDLPEWPEEIGPPPGPRNEGMIPLNSSKGALSFAYTYGPFGTIP